MAFVFAQGHHAKSQRYLARLNLILVLIIDRFRMRMRKNTLPTHGIGSIKKIGDVQKNDIVSVDCVLERRVQLTRSTRQTRSSAKGKGRISRVPEIAFFVARGVLMFERLGATEPASIIQASS